MKRRLLLDFWWWWRFLFLMKFTTNIAYGVICEGRRRGGSFYIRPHCIKQTGFEYPSWTKPKAKLYQGWAHIWWRTKKLVNSRNLLRQHRRLLVLLTNAVWITKQRWCLLVKNFFLNTRSISSVHKCIETTYSCFSWCISDWENSVTLMGTRTARARRTKAADGCPVPVDDYMLHRRGPLRLVLSGVQEWEVNDQNIFSYQ